MDTTTKQVAARVFRVPNEIKLNTLKTQAAHQLGVQEDRLVWNDIPKMTINGQAIDWEPERGELFKTFTGMYQYAAHIKNNIPGLMIAKDLRRDFEYVTLCLEHKNPEHDLNKYYAKRLRFYYEQALNLNNSRRRISQECLGFKTFGKSTHRDEREYCDERQKEKKLGLKHALTGLIKKHGTDLNPLIQNASYKKLIVPAIANISRAGFSGTQLVEGHNVVVVKDFSMDSCAFINPYTRQNNKMEITGIRQEVEGEAAGLFSIDSPLSNGTAINAIEQSLAITWADATTTNFPDIIPTSLCKVGHCLKSVAENTTQPIKIPNTCYLRPNAFTSRHMLDAVSFILDRMPSPTEMHANTPINKDHIIFPFLDQDIAA